MGWLKLTKQALYLMKGGTDRYLHKVDLNSINPSEQSVYIPREWFRGSDNGFSGSMGMIVSVLADGPEPRPFRSLHVTDYPKSGVAVGQKFAIRGIVDAEYAGELISLTIDNQFRTSGPAVLADGRWQVLFQFTQPGTRQLKISIGTESVTLKLIVKAKGQNLVLTGSVGWNGDNRPEDVVAVKQRLANLGYPNINVSKTVDQATVRAIRLFQAIIAGYQMVISVDGRIKPGTSTYQWLKARNAPKWQLMPLRGEGFFNFERMDESDNHDYGTSWMAEALIAVGKSYQVNYRSRHPGAAPVAINDVSQPYGGDTPDHAGHETGLSCDILIPLVNGDYGGTTWESSDYDRQAMRAQLQAIRDYRWSSQVFFNDPVLINEGLCILVGGHDRHAHFEIRPPTRQD